MIDIENEIITKIHDKIIVSYPNAKFESVLNLNPSDFPCICIEEIDNTSYSMSIDSASNENHAAVVFEINIFTNNATGKKGTAKAILSDIDSLMMSMGFSRILKNPISLDEGTKYRIVTRYNATVSADHTIYRR